jgi:hypothetical protein
MAKLEDNSPMPFGKYKGIALLDVPASYFHYLWTNGMEHDTKSDVADYIRRNKKALAQEYPNGIW